MSDGSKDEKVSCTCVARHADDCRFIIYRSGDPAESPAPPVPDENVTELLTTLQKRTEELEDLLISARSIAQRKGAETAWERFDARIANLGIGSITPRVFKILPSDNKLPISVPAPPVREPSKLEQIKVAIGNILGEAEHAMIYGETYTREDFKCRISSIHQLAADALKES